MTREALNNCSRKGKKRKAFKQTHFLVHEKFMRNIKNVFLSLLRFLLFVVLPAKCHCPLKKHHRSSHPRRKIAQGDEAETGNLFCRTLERKKSWLEKKNRKCASTFMWVKPERKSHLMDEIPRRELKIFHEVTLL